MYSKLTSGRYCMGVVSARVKTSIAGLKQNLAAVRCSKRHRCDAAASSALRVAAIPKQCHCNAAKQLPLSAHV